MKKLMTLTIAVAAMCAMGAVTPDPADETMLAITNRVNYRCLDIRVWPKTAPVAMRELGYEESTPALCAIYRKYAPAQTDIRFIDWYRICAVATTEEAVAAIGEAVTCDSRSLPYMTNGGKILNAVLSSLEKKAVVAVRMYLKKKGKSFVTKNGVNPCAELIKGFNDAVNAPRLDGLDKWFRDMGYPEARLDVTSFPDDATVKAMKDRFISGEEDLTQRWQNILRYCLGLEEYNRFVKEYNGED